MFKASVGGGVAARWGVYRHALARAVSGVLGPLAVGVGWSAAATALAAVLMSWDPAPTLAQRFESVLALLDAALPRRRRTGRTYQGFVKALAGRSAALLGVLVPRFRAATERAAGARWRIGGFVPIGVDGSRFDAPRTIGNEPLGFAGKDKCSPQMMMVLLVHLGAMLPWGWTIGGARDAERTLLRGLLDDLPDRTLLVADAGFTGFDLLSEFGRRGISFLVRVGRGVHLLKDLGHYRRQGKHTVSLWPHGARSSPPLTLRLIRVGSAWLVTDVTDPRRLSRRAAGELYRRRWGCEVAFRTLKQTLEHRKVRSGAAPHARRELDWAVLGLWALMLLGARAIAPARIAPDRLSAAKTLAAVRAARLTPTSDRALHRRLRRCVLDPYRRRTRKTAYRRASKKRAPAPGPPTIAIASAAQVARAKELRARLLAA